MDLSTPDPRDELSRLVLDTIGDLVVLFRSADDGAPVTVSVSESWARAFASTQADWLAKTVYAVLPEASAARVADLTTRSTPEMFDDVLPTPDGDRHVEVTVTSTTCSGEEYVLWVGRDVAEQRRSERDMRSLTDDLQRSNSELAEFATVASHDVKEPLRMITAYLELLERRYGEHLDDRGHQYLGYALEGAARLRGMTDALLDWATVRTTPVVIAPTDLHAVVSSIRAELAVALNESGARITVGQLAVIDASEPLVHTLLQNLVANAAKFCPEQPRIHLECTPVDAHWLITVDDDGPGVPAPLRSAAFTMFRRLHPRTTHPGNGMGLAVCRGIAELHGGDIWIDDSPLGGTRVCVRLPRTEPPKDAR